MNHLLEYEGYDPRKNHKPSVEFDEIYGTNLSHKYDFHAYTEDEIWDRWVTLREGGPKGPFLETLKILPEAFPYLNTSKLDVQTKANIMLGMVSGYNPEDIHYFSVEGVIGSQNIEQKRLMEKLPLHVARKIQWVLSPGSVEKIKQRFGIID